MKTLSRSVALAVTAGALIVCLVLLIGGISMQKSMQSQNKAYTGTVEATVAGYEVHQEEMETIDANDITRTQIVDFYHPVFEYTVDGKEYRIVSDSGSGSKDYAEGSAVTLCYLPEDPSQVYVSGDSSRTFLPYVMYALSLICGIVAVKTFITAWKNNG